MLDRLNKAWFLTKKKTLQKKIYKVQSLRSNKIPWQPQAAAMKTNSSCNAQRPLVLMTKNSVKKCKSSYPKTIKVETKKVYINWMEKLMSMSIKGAVDRNTKD
jgi:hypothetical protein